VGQNRAYWGLTRALIANLITGVTTGYSKRLEGVKAEGKAGEREFVLAAAVSKGQFKRLATSLGFEVLEVSSVMDASGVIDTGWEERAVAEITITWSEEESTTYDGTIESAVVTGTADSIDVEVTAP